jgi:hypothetical protein
MSSRGLTLEVRLTIPGQLHDGCHFKKSQAISKCRRLEN